MMSFCKCRGTEPQVQASYRSRARFVSSKARRAPFCSVIAEMSSNKSPTQAMCASVGIKTGDGVSRLLDVRRARLRARAVL
jgi:hypothetical protein